MIEFTAEKLSTIPQRERAHLINNLCGLRSANLIGTQSGTNVNLAVFNSVLHLGSQPPLLGIVFRPLTVERHTYDYIKETKLFSVNQLPISRALEGHHTSAKFTAEQSEFDQCGFTPLYREGLTIPFVKESHIQILCSYSKEHRLENDCILLTGRIVQFWVSESILESDHWINHEMAESVAIGGLDAYYSTSLIDRFSYAKPEQTPHSIASGNA